MNASASSIVLLARADLVLLLADAFRPPRYASTSLAGLQAADLSSFIEATQFPGRDEIVPRLEVLLRSAHLYNADAWSDEFHRLFEGSVACPLNETAYIRRDKGAIIGDLAGYYRAFGWTPAGNLGEKPDHLLSELEFLAVLMAMAAQAQYTQEHLEVTTKAIDSFVANHLGDWIGCVGRQLEVSTSSDYYRELADTLQAIWQALAGAHHWPAPADLSLIPQVDGGTPYECGAPAIQEALS